MKKYKLPLIRLTGTAVIMLFLAASTYQNNLSKQLIGEWRNVYIKLTINTFKTNKTQVMEADSNNWEARLQIHPIRTHFKGDGTYYSEYLNLKDSIIRRVTGTWKINQADTLTMSQLTPDKSVTRLHLSIRNNRATFTGLIDFDGDGRNDDAYFGIQKKYAAK